MSDHYSRVAANQPQEKHNKTKTMQATKYQNTTWSTLAAAGVLLSSTVVCQVEAQTKDPLLDALIRKGVLTEQEAKNIKSELPKESASGSNIQMSWKDGIEFQSADKKTFKGKISGRLQLDVASFSQDDDSETTVGDIPAGAEFRRARLSAEGEFGLALPTFFKLEVDFAGEIPDEGTVAFKDVYLGVRSIPGVNNFQVGHFKEPSSLEGLTSSRYLTFLERSAAVEAFWPERNLGAMVYNTALDERMTWAAGGFTEVDDTNPASDLDSNWRAVGRVAGQPWWDEDSKGRKFVHLGISGSYYEPRGGAHRFRSRPEAHLAPRFVDTGSIPADHSILVGTEAAVVYGPFSVQGEYFRNWVSGTTTPTGDSPSFDGYYLFGSWFITGENRAYRRATGAFDRLRPTNNFGWGEHSGAGAWELALRYSRVNLNDEGIRGGRLHDYTAGVNWYLNPNMKIQFNYVLANLERNSLESNTHIFETRFATDF